MQPELPFVRQVWPVQARQAVIDRAEHPRQSPDQRQRPRRRPWRNQNARGPRSDRFGGAATYQDPHIAADRTDTAEGASSCTHLPENLAHVFGRPGVARNQMSQEQDRPDFTVPIGLAVGDKQCTAPHIGCVVSNLFGAAPVPEGTESAAIWHWQRAVLLSAWPLRQSPLAFAMKSDRCGT